MTEKNNSSTLDSDKISNQKNHLPSNKNKHSSKISLESPIQSEQSNYNIDSLTDLIDLVKTQNTNLIKDLISSYISNLFEKQENLKDYELIILHDKYESINTLHSNNIYKTISTIEHKKDILMFLLSDGGKIEPAYLISKACKRLCKEKFVVTVPRRAKSAATLIALGAKEIHMGLLSELGPIDPQINGFPALGLANALEKIALLSDKFPKSSDMFAKYLTDNLSIKDLGYFERINESAIQYAMRLLDGKKFPDNQTPHSLANHFTNHYKDHSFVIDVEEALKYIGPDVIKENTVEYNFSDFLYNKLNLIDLVLTVFIQKRLRIIGSYKNIDDIYIDDAHEES